MQKLLSLAALALIVGFLSSCSKDDDNGNQLSRNDAKAKLDALNDETTADLEDLADADGFTALRSLFDLTELDDPFAGRTTSDKQKIRNYFRKKGNELRTIFIKKTDSNGRINNEEPFDFNAHKGVYVWDFQNEVFVKTGASTIIKILFPTEGSTTNNAELQITAYTEVEFYDSEWQEIYYEPQVIQASLKVAAEEVASLDLNIDWDEDGFPLAADITVELVPYTGNLSFDVSASTSSTVSAFVKKGTETLIATSVTVNYSNSTKSEESIETIEGYVQVKDVKLQGEVDVDGMDHSSNGDPNDYVHLALYSDNVKLGDIIFVEEEVDGYDEWVPYLQYADGSKEALEDILEPIVDQLEDLEDDISDNG
jgi:hypothetical protein